VVQFPEPEKCEVVILAFSACAMKAKRKIRTLADIRNNSLFIISSQESNLFIVLDKYHIHVDRSYKYQDTSCYERRYIT
jgi:hypothetical protein